MKWRWVIWIGFFLGNFSSQAYPWKIFDGISKENQSNHIVEMDIRTSYFFAQKSKKFSIFSGLNLNYYNSIVSVHGGGEYSFLEKMSYFYIRDFALTFPTLEENWSVTLGFKNQLWSVADRYWNYGLWQARYMVDLFRPVQMGHPGLYINHDGNISVTFLISYFYIPNIDVRPRLKNKKITSRNPFFSEINDSNLTELILDELKLLQPKKFLKAVVALQLKHSLPDLNDSSISLSYAYKPSNQLQYGIFLPKGGGVNVSIPKDKATFTGLDYIVTLHHLASLEGELTLAKSPSEKFSVFASALFEYPEYNQKVFGKQWITDFHEPHLILSLLSYFEETLEDRLKFLFTLGYSRIIESRLHFNNNLTESWEPIFAGSFDWKHALSASAEYQNKDWGFLSRLRMNYALDNQFYAFALDNEFNLTSFFKIYLSGDIVFRFSNSLIEKWTSSVYKYKHLSRIFIGGKGVF